MIDVKGDEVRLGDEVYLGQKRGILDKAIFVKETKTHFYVRCIGASANVGIRKYEWISNPIFNLTDYYEARYDNTLPPYTITAQILVDISDKPCPRIIKV